MKQKLIFQGAEARVYLIDKKVLKQRISKSYRHPNLDESLRKSRTKKEAKILEKAISLKINVPNIIKQDKFDLEIEYISGEKLSDNLNFYSKEKQNNVIKEAGKQISLLHKNDIIHGDLTTSNMILSKENKVFIIDFGLGYISKKIEDKAVDLHLIKQALEAKHFKNHEELFKNLIKNYKSKDSKKVLERLKAVEKRGRYKH